MAAVCGNFTGGSSDQPTCLNTYVLGSERLTSNAELLWNATSRMVFYLVVVHLVETLHATLARVQAESVTDPLTGLANRRAFYAALNREIVRARRSAQPITLAYIDLDNFKAVNDTRGHQAGDDVLTRVAGALGNLRALDLAARLGGDEFAILLPETGSAGAEVAVARLRDAIARALVGAPLEVTCSIGVVTFNTPPSSIDDAIAAADGSMYRAKIDGKARAVFSTLMLA